MKTALKRLLGITLVALFVMAGTATLAFAAPGERLGRAMIRGEGPLPRMARLEQRISRLTENQARIEEHLVNARERAAELQERIPTIEDPAQKAFAERQLDILLRCIEHITGRLSLMAEQLELLQDMLEYSQSL